MPTPNKYPRELRGRAVRMVAEIGEHCAVARVAGQLGVKESTLRYWMNHTPADKGGRIGLSTAEFEELHEPRRALEVA